MPKLLAIVLVPLDDRAALHRCRLERHDAVETLPRDDHPARVLAEMTRKVEHAGVHLHVLCKPIDRRVGSKPASVNCLINSSSVCVP